MVKSFEVFGWNMLEAVPVEKGDSFDGSLEGNEKR